ncbi:U4/U6 small nuclear ribonucleoprotein Prp4, partial [Perkinsus olseni]
LQPAAVLEGHELRVNNVEYVPVYPQLVASTSHDDTWRLWDIEKQEEILLQEGHNHPVFGLAIHPCGSLIATSDMSGVVRVWDLRTGRTVLPLTYEDGGHCKGTPRLIPLDASLLVWLSRFSALDFKFAHTTILTRYLFRCAGGGLLPERLPAGHWRYGQ